MRVMSTRSRTCCSRSKAPTVATSARNDSADVGVPATAAAPPLVTGRCDCYVER
jgi:hypothetical protein